MADAFSFAPFQDLLVHIEVHAVETFAEIEDQFVAAMSAFDQRLAAGDLTSGQNQNKGLFFNELIARLVERCAGLGVAQRGKRPGILLPTVDVDLCYPADPRTRPAIIAEVKMAGTPEASAQSEGRCYGSTGICGRRQTDPRDSAQRYRPEAG